MTIDFNTASAEQHQEVPSKEDWEQLSRALAGSAEDWVPKIFPRGKIVDGVLRCANISGSPPRKQGSCVIQLTGDHAGSYCNHSLGTKGGPCATLKETLGLSGQELYDRGWQIAGAPRPNGHAKSKRSSDDHKLEAAFALSQSGPSAGTLVETYFAARGLTLPPTDDLKYNPTLTYWPTKTGVPALVAIVRHPRRPADRWHS
jgi:hypothetical protein